MQPPLKAHFCKLAPHFVSFAAAEPDSTIFCGACTKGRFPLLLAFAAAASPLARAEHNPTTSHQ